MVKEASLPFQIASLIPTSGTAVFTSSASSVIYRDSVGYQVNVIGNTSGTLNINGSIDYNPGAPQSAGTANAGNWTTITSTTIGSGSLYPNLFNLNQLAMAWTQLQYTSVSGSGTLSVWTSAKSLG